MAVYFVFVGFVLGISILRDTVASKYKTALTVFLFFVVFLFMGLRYGIGQDYFFTYVPIFESVANTGQANGVESGFILLNRICSLFTSDYWLIFLVTAFIFVFFIFKTISQYELPYFWVLFIFICGGFYFYSFNVMRQCMTIAMFYYSLQFVHKKKFIPFLLVNMFGFLLHETALLFIPLYFLLGKRYKNIIYILMITLCFALRFVAVPALNAIFTGTKYGNYLTGYYSDSSKLFNVSQVLNVLVFIVMLFLVKADSLDKKGIILLNVHFFGVLATEFMGVVPLAFRITTMFYLLQFITVPYAIKKYCKKDYALIFYAMCFVVYFALFMNTLINNGNNIIPYRTIFER